MDIEKIVLDIKKSKKYRYICTSTIEHMVLTGIRETNNIKKGVKYAKKKLHHIAALYLGDPDYDKEILRLEQAVKSLSEEDVKSTCRNILSHHLSTKERVPLLCDFYKKIFQITGKPETILDIASGLNPLTILWMGLSDNIKYYAYEINEKRVDFLNSFFSLLNISRLAKFQDVLIDFPQEEGDIAFLLKMVHCFERRKKGSSLPILENLKARYLVVSFPSKNLTHKRNIGHIYEKMFLRIIEGKQWHVEKIIFESELVFCIKKY